MKLNSFDKYLPDTEAAAQQERSAVKVLTAKTFTNTSQNMLSEGTVLYKQHFDDMFELACFNSSLTVLMIDDLLKSSIFFEDS